MDTEGDCRMTNEVDEKVTSENQNPAQGDESKALDGDKPLSLEEALAQIEHLRGINKEVIESRDKVKSKLKSYEDEAQQQQAQLLEEQGKYKELYEAQQEKARELELKLRTAALDREIDQSLSEIGLAPEALKTAKSLVDRSSIKFDNDNIDKSSVADAIEQLKKEHAVLFNIKRQTPDVKRPNVDTDQSTYEVELQRIRANPKSPTARKELEQLRAKYGKI